MAIGFIDKVEESGIVGAGGAGFPTHVKLSAKVEYIIMNAAECEPLIRVDQQLLEYYTREIIEGLNIVLKECGARKAYIAIKAKHSETIEKINKLLKGYEKIEVFQLDDFYPAGDEQVTVYEVLKRVVPQGRIPLDVDSIVCNVETILNVFNATKDIPVISTYVTVTGEVPKPVTYKLPIGMSYSEVLKTCGVENFQGKAIIDGGPMMGNVVDDFDKPITKTTKAIILLDRNHSLIQTKTMDVKQSINKSKVACIQCSRCTDLCPRDLMGHKVKPHLIMRLVNYGLHDLEGMKTALACSECGACELFACPNLLSPRKINAGIKHELKMAGVKANDSVKNFEASAYRGYRSIPVKRLIQRLGIKKFDVEAPLEKVDIIPDKVEILLNQHTGVSAVPLVEIGSQVSERDIIAKVPDGKLGANIHASISGVVTKITKEAIVIELK